MDSREFEDEVFRAVESLPPDFALLLDNLEVMVRRAPAPGELRKQGLGPGETLLGLYEGVPLTGRGYGYNLITPDCITIFMDPVLAHAGHTGEPPSRVIRRVVLHEIAHHFGMPEARLRELGY